MVYGLTRDDIEDFGISLSDEKRLNRLIITSYFIMVIIILCFYHYIFYTLL